MKKLLTLFAAALLLIFLVGCSKHKPSGEVFKKEHHPERWQMESRPTTVIGLNGKIGTTFVIINVYYPAQWSITISWYNEAKEITKYHKYYVPETVYNQFEVGDYFDYELVLAKES